MKCANCGEETTEFQYLTLAVSKVREEDVELKMETVMWNIVWSVCLGQLYRQFLHYGQEIYYDQVWERMSVYVA